MQFSVMRTYAATRFRDTNNIIVADADWKNYINDRYEDMLSRCTWFPWNETQSTLSFGASVSSQPLPTDVWQLLAVWDSTNQFPMVPLEGRDQYLNEYPQQTEVGFAMHWRVFDGSLFVYPMPSSTTVYRIDYVKRPADLVADADVPVFPSQYHATIVKGALALAYTDDGNLQMAEAHQAQYETEVKNMVMDLMQPRQSRFHEPIDTFL